MGSLYYLMVLANIALITGIAGAGCFLFSKPAAGSLDMRELLACRERRDKFGNKVALDVDLIKKETARRKGSRKAPDDVATRLFRAGYFRPQDRQLFFYAQVITLIISVVVCTLSFMKLQNPLLVICGVVLGAFIGFGAPVSWLERKICAREKETMYYLPLVIEQILIGTSSGLDIGPCIASITHMAKERDIFNPVTEMLIHTEKLVLSGLNLEDSLIEVGEAIGNLEVKHTFMFLAQCSKHGGEISHQLLGLANAVIAQRRVHVEGRMTALPAMATLPLTCVAFGFFLILGSGIYINILAAFPSG